MIDDYLAIQMLQSRLTIYTDSIQAHRIGEELFADLPDAELDLGERGQARGYAQICRFYTELDERIRQNGNTLGSDLAASQQIRFDGGGETAGAENGQIACGTWFTYTVDVKGPAFGNTALPYPYVVSVGRYDNTFVKTPDGWRILKLHRRPVLEFTPYVLTGNPDGTIRQKVEDWPQPYEPYPHAQHGKAADNGGTRGCPGTPAPDADDEAFCSAVMAVKNLMGRYTEYCMDGRYHAVVDELYAKRTEDVSCFIQGMPQKMHGLSNIRTYYDRAEKKAGALSGSVHLLTTAVVEPFLQGPGTAEAAWTSLTLEPVGRDDHAGIVFANKTCRWNVSFVLEEGEWKILSLNRVVYSTMPDLTGSWRKEGA